MAGVVSVPANEGRISVKNECDDPEIIAMALKMKEKYKKTALATAKQPSTSPANVYINRAGRAVTLTIAPISQKNNQEKLPKDSEDIKSIQGQFSWKQIAGFHVPVIIRIINGEELKFVSVRMAETQLLNHYLHYLHADIYTYTSVGSHFITNSEAKLLNEINIKHCDGIYGKDPFYAVKDYVVRLEDVLEFYTFIEVCYQKLMSNIIPGRNEKCGFIRINSESVVPYCLKDGCKYVPLFYFEGEIENLRNRAIKIENWNLAYLKFCCKVQGIRNELYTSESCTVTSLDDIKNYFPPDTHFEEYWPAKVIDTQLLTNQKSNHVNLSGVWIRAPPEIPVPECTIPHSLTASAPVMPQSMPVVMNTFQNGWPPNQMVNSFTTPAMPPPHKQQVAILLHPEIKGPSMSHGNSLMNGGNYVIPPPPLVRVNSMAPVIGKTVSYSNTVPNSQCITTIYNPVPSSSVISHSNQIQQFYNQYPSNNSQARQQQMQQQQVQQHQQQQQQQQQQIITTQVQPYRGPISVHGRLTNTQQRNAIRNVAPFVFTPASEIIDLSSPPSSPAPTPVQDARLRPNVGWELKKIPERIWAQGSTNNAAYKIQKTTLHGRMIHCINSKPYIYSDLMVTLDDLIQTLLPSCTVSRCAHLLNKYLNITLFCGNSDQMNVLLENGRLRSTYAKNTPMVMLQDITHALPQLKNLLSKQNQQIQQYQSAAGPSKRHRTS
ncbi:hypothetical protein AGLY_014567 [Aphis glycines]|uniref:Uncharacterized protein n=1 Tax=Aphis glycines TaxID=307491 RepID=A0A6G0T3D8_APHGL|nr:hypothetical protein AGLY_014567 [Aphis glycines]